MCGRIGNHGYGGALIMSVFVWLKTPCGQGMSLRTPVLTADLSCFTPSTLSAPGPAYHPSRRVIQDRPHCLSQCQDRHSLFWEDRSGHQFPPMSCWKTQGREGFRNLVCPASCSSALNQLRMAETQGLAGSVFSQPHCLEDQGAVHITRKLLRAQTLDPGCPGSHLPLPPIVRLWKNYFTMLYLSFSICKMGMIVAPA